MAYAQPAGLAFARRRDESQSAQRGVVNDDRKGSELVNATRARLERRYGHKPAYAKLARPDNGATQSLVGGNAHGFSGRLDFVGWPARPGEPQRDFEPPRVTSGRTPNRAARLKALGNAVVPQVVFPLFLAIREWLEEQSIQQVA